MTDSQATEAISTDIYFITGGTGLMASEFIAEVLAKDVTSTCILLIRAESKVKAEARTDKLLRYLFPEDASYVVMRTRVSTVLGDVSKDRLGLSDSDWSQLLFSVNYILHAAALTDWGATIEEASYVNIKGVGEILNLAHHCHGNLKKFVHISSAYLSGTHDGRVYPESMYDDDSPCDNYQLTKREGERLMRDAWTSLPITIVRPGAVVGNSVNGRTLTFKTFYFPLQLLYNGMPLILPVNKRGTLEAVPSDWTAKVMLALMGDNSTNGQCFHLTNGWDVFENKDIRLLILKTFKDFGEKTKGIQLIPYILYKYIVAPLMILKHPNGKRLDKKITLYRHYMTYQRVFDNTTTIEFIKDKNIPIHKFETYLHTLMQYAIDTRWHKKRESLRSQDTKVRVAKSS